MSFLTSSGLEVTAPVMVLYMLSTPLYVEYLESAEHRKGPSLPFVKWSERRLINKRRLSSARLRLLLLSSARFDAFIVVRLAILQSLSLNSGRDLIFLGMGVPSLM